MNASILHWAANTTTVYYRSMADPYSILLNIERRCFQNRAGLPQIKEIREEWRGFGFRIGQTYLLVPMDEVAEILNPPGFTRVPGVKSWIMGIANVRGNLLPLMDLKGFLFGEEVSRRRGGRIIVVNHSGHQSGLVVDEVLGLKHFYLEEQTDVLPALRKGLQPYIVQAFVRDGQYWPVFSLQQLSEDERFYQVSS